MRESLAGDRSQAPAPHVNHQLSIPASRAIARCMAVSPWNGNARPSLTSTFVNVNTPGACMTLASVRRQRGLLLFAATLMFFALTAWAQDDGTDTLNDLK